MTGLTRPVDPVFCVGIPVRPGSTLVLSCSCCGTDETGWDTFAGTTCWDCVAGKPGCENCLINGIWVDRHSKPHQKGIGCGCGPRTGLRSPCAGSRSRWSTSGRAQRSVARAAATGSPL